ncbi:hypothetical protein [Bradyrhizobium sp. BR 10289]|uniref:hypothetical protein n=1 Tax=Bradyrhizobium sp. BR 10289 TaxID=2749993 RepID=UPI001C64F085|nr:hypothetical protein [Bradyrhizobium sp. BR 10289]MBW7968601.1 hypothetical protein [Bradyrhizobium sp. BR 10289]
MYDNSELFHLKEMKQGSISGNKDVNGARIPWTRREDDKLRELVDAGAPIEVICETLCRTEQELRKRGYDIGLPMKWFKRPRPRSQLPAATPRATLALFQPGEELS